MPDTSPEMDPLVDEMPSRYVVGIDLGTTNCAVCFVDTKPSAWKVRVFRIPQLTAAGEVESRETLPAFHYQPVLHKSNRDTLKLPWPHRRYQDDSKSAARRKKKNTDRQKAKPEIPNYAVGYWARDEGTLAPGRLIASAKSWLCHVGVDRTADL